MTDISAAATAAVPMATLSAPANREDRPPRLSPQSPGRLRPSRIPVVRVTGPAPRTAPPRFRQSSSRIPVSSTGPPPRFRPVIQPTTNRQIPMRQQSSIANPPRPQPVLLPSSPPPPSSISSSSPVDQIPDVSAAESGPAAHANGRGRRHGFVCACKRTLRSIACW